MKYKVPIFDPDEFGVWFTVWRYTRYQQWTWWQTYRTKYEAERVRDLMVEYLISARHDIKILRQGERP